jgi:TetR/AcrR family transcriptional repressor of nem operon
MDGCPIVALGSDAARQGMDVKASFEAGIKEHLEILGRFVANTSSEESDGKAMAILSTMVGALTLSRVVNDPDLARAFLDSATDQVREAAAA